MSNHETIAGGTNRRFQHVESTTASRDAIWGCWTDPATWGVWDAGLRSAALDRPFGLGARGTIVPLKGPKSSFVVEALDPGRSYTFATSMPGATLRVRREFVDDETVLANPTDRRTVFQHTVWFDGPMAWLFSRLYGMSFRRALPPTMRRLVEVAEAS